MTKRMTYNMIEALHTRTDWFKVVPVEAAGGGYDIALIIDGSYTAEATGQEIAKYWASVFSVEDRHDGR